MLRLYDSRLSGNAWKVRILLTQLGIPFERVTLDLAEGATSDPAFCAKSRFARVPVLELEGGRTIVESAAIMLYLAEGSRLLPDDRYLRAEVASWLTFEQADLLRALALPRFYHMRGIADQKKGRIADFQEGAYVASACCVMPTPATISRSSRPSVRGSPRRFRPALHPRQPVRLVGPVDFPKPLNNV